MKKRILLWGAVARVDPKLPSITAFEYSGKNFGNLLIGNAVHSFLAGNEIIIRSQLKSPEEANERCDHVVMPAANFLWKDFDLGFMADFFEKTTLPVTIIADAVASKPSLAVLFREYNKYMLRRAAGLFGI